jgi:hypothetical protein
MSKELWLQAHEDLVAEYLDLNPGTSWSLAYEITADHVNDRLRDRYAEMIDHARMMEKE